MSLMGPWRLMCCYQHRGFGEFLSSGSRVQSSHFPDPLFLRCPAHEKPRRQWATPFWNCCYNDRKTQLHTSLGVTGNTLRSGRAQPHSHNWVSYHCHHQQWKRLTECDFKQLAKTQKQSVNLKELAHWLKLILTDLLGYSDTDEVCFMQNAEIFILD